MSKELKESFDVNEPTGWCAHCKHAGVKTRTKYYVRNAANKSVWRCEPCHSSLDDDYGGPQSSAPPASAPSSAPASAPSSSYEQGFYDEGWKQGFNDGISEMSDILRGILMSYGMPLDTGKGKGKDNSKGTDDKRRRTG